MKAFENLLFQLATIMGGFGIYETIYGKWSDGPIIYNEGQFDLQRLIISVILILALCIFYALCLADSADTLDKKGDVVESRLMDPKNGLTKMTFMMTLSFLLVLALSYYIMGLRQAFCFGTSMVLLLSAEGVKFIVTGFKVGLRVRGRIETKR